MGQESVAQVVFHHAGDIVGADQGCSNDRQDGIGPATVTVRRIRVLVSAGCNLRAEWQRIRARVDSICGWIPYGASLNWGLRVFRRDGYRLQESIPYLEATFTSLDYVWNGEMYLERGHLKFNWTNPRETDKHVKLKWTVADGWTIRGAESGRRTRPLPKFIAAVLCGTLIWVSPDILRVAFEHAEKTNEPMHVYAVLIVVLLSLVAMVGIYMWLGYKAEPTGLDKLLRGFGKSMGRKESTKDSPVLSPADSEAPVTDPPRADDNTDESRPSENSTPATSGEAGGRVATSPIVEGGERLSPPEKSGR